MIFEFNFQDIDVGLVLKLQSKISQIEKENEELHALIESYEEEGSPSQRTSTVISESAFDALKVKVFYFKSLVNHMFYVSTLL